MANADQGYDELFLGLPAPLPIPDAPTVTLDYVHFTVLLRPDRRLAAVTAVNIHGGLLVEIDRVRDNWILDSRVPAASKPGPRSTGPTISTVDIWSVAAIRVGARPHVAKAANDDTFHYTNAAPRRPG